MEMSHIIEPERQGLWIAVGFVVALLALVVGSVAIYRIDVVGVVTQTEVLMLNKKIEQLKSEQAKQSSGAPQQAVPTPAAPAK